MESSESHFTELKFGWVNGQANVADPTLKWDIGRKNLLPMLAN